MRSIVAVEGAVVGGWDLKHSGTRQCACRGEPLSIEAVPFAPTTQGILNRSKIASILDGYAKDVVGIDAIGVAEFGHER